MSSSSSKLLRALDSNDKESDTNESPLVQLYTPASGVTTNCYPSVSCQNTVGFQTRFQQFITTDKTAEVIRPLLSSAASCFCPRSPVFSSYSVGNDRSAVVGMPCSLMNTNAHLNITSFHSYAQPCVVMGNRESSGGPSAASSVMSDLTQNSHFSADSSSLVRVLKVNDFSSHGVPLNTPRAPSCVSYVTQTASGSAMPSRHAVLSPSCSRNLSQTGGTAQLLHHVMSSSSSNNISMNQSGCTQPPLRHVIQLPVRVTRLVDVSIECVSPEVHKFPKIYSSNVPAAGTTADSCSGVQMPVALACSNDQITTIHHSASASMNVSDSSIEQRTQQLDNIATPATSTVFANNMMGPCYQRAQSLQHQVTPVGTAAVTRTVASPTSTSSVAAGTLTCNVPAAVETVMSVLSVIDAPVQQLKVALGNSAVITRKDSQPTACEGERPYVAGRRYTITKEDGTVVEGVWDGKYLAVSAASSASSQGVASSSTTTCSNTTAQLAVTVDCHSPSVKRTSSQSVNSGLNLPECCVKLDKLERDCCGGKRMKMQSSINAKSKIDKSSFYGKTSDSKFEAEACRAGNTRRQIYGRRNLQVADEPIVIHIDEDEDDDIIISPCDDKDNGCNVVRDTDNALSNSDNDEVVLSIPVNSVEYCRGLHTFGMAKFQRRKLTIYQNTDDKGSNCLTISRSDIASLHCEPAQNSQSLLHIFVTIRKSCQLRLHKYFNVPVNSRSDPNSEQLVIIVSEDFHDFKLLMHAITTLNSDDEIGSHGSVDSTFEMECQDISSSSPYASNRMDSESCQQQPASYHTEPLTRPALHITHTTSALQAIHAYDGCDLEDEDQEVQQENDPSQKDEIIVSMPFSSDIIKLFTYPAPPVVGGITVTNEDLFCLNDGEFLNDVVIEFFIKYLYNEVLTQSDREKTHIFNTFFYGQLTKENMDTSSGLSQQQRRHFQVKRWTKHVDLFSKDFIIIPINEDSHWYLAIICFPRLAASQPATTQASVRKGPISTCLDASIKSIDEVPEENKKPCILIFDSLKNGANRWNVAVILREYLQVEWDLKKAPYEGKKSFDKPIMKGATPGCPQQSNSSDCGVYVLQYIESFFKHPLHDFSLPIRYLNDWFPRKEVDCKRRDIRRLILSLTHRLNPSINYNPKHDGCDVDDED